MTCGANMCTPEEEEEAQLANVPVFIKTSVDVTLSDNGRERVGGMKAVYCPTNRQSLYYHLDENMWAGQ